MSDETPIPWIFNDRARMVLDRLKEGPTSTVELQEGYLVHVARQIWELRHWYGYQIQTRRLPNGVAVYRLLGRDGVTPPSKPVFGDPSAIRRLRAGAR